MPPNLKPKLGHLLLLGVVLVAGGAAGATTLPFTTDELGEYLIVGMGPVNDAGPSVGVGQASNTNSFELGANKAPVPSTGDFLDGGSSGGPTLEGNVPDLPSGIEPVPQGITGDGNVAITHEDGVFNFQDVGVYADRGVDCAAATDAACDDGTSNSFFNDPNQFPNTFDTGTQTGVSINPGDADPSTRIDDGNFAGVNSGTDFTILLAEIADAKTEIPNLVSTSVLDLSDVGGTIKPDTFGDISASGITLSTPDANTLAITVGSSGLHVIDIDTGGNDFKVENANLVIDGPLGALVLIRLPSTGGVTDQNMLISNANILAGDGGIGLEGIVFVSNRDDNGQHFNFSNTIVNGVAFWSIGMAGGEINIDNAQGCTQLVADKVTLNDVRFSRCAFGVSVPEPGSGALAAVAVLGLALSLRRARSGP